MLILCTKSTNDAICHRLHAFVKCSVNSPWLACLFIIAMKTPQRGTDREWWVRAVGDS